MLDEQKIALAEFINENISRSPFTAAEIALKCEFQSERAILAFARGDIRLPLDKVALLADAIECSKDELLTLVLKSWFPKAVVELLQTSLAATTVLEGRERTWIEAIQKFGGGRVPELTPKLRRRLQLVLKTS